MGNKPPSIIRNKPPSIIRQPPSPSSQLVSEMVCCNIRSTRTIYYPGSCIRKTLTEIESLPDEVLFEVLVRLPAQDIYESARLVCSKWYHMIHTHTFIHAHLQHSPFGFFFQSLIKEDSLFMAVGKSGKIEISKLNYKRGCKLSTSCNGLSLEFQEGNLDNLYVSNPATRQIFVLPPNKNTVRNVGLHGIGYAAASMEYKAVIPFPSCFSTKGKCYILTIGVDKSWRTVGTERVSLAATKAFARSPLIAEGFMLWCNPTNAVLTLNLETEVLTETCGPLPRGVYGTQGDVYLSTGRHFSLLIKCGELCWEVWEMKPKIDYQWRKVSDISLEAHKYSTFGHEDFKLCYELLRPVGWVKYPEVFLFTVCGRRPSMFVFNLISQEISTIELPSQLPNYSYIQHKNSLMWL